MVVAAAARRRPKGLKQDWMLRSVGGGDFFSPPTEVENPCPVLQRIRQREGSSRKTIVMASTFLRLPRRTMLRQQSLGESREVRLGILATWLLLRSSSVRPLPPPPLTTNCENAMH